MTNHTKRALAQRAATAIRVLGLDMPPGMRATWPDDARPCRRYGSPGETAGWVSDYSGKERDITDAHALPDLDDDATKGAMLGLVRRAWDDPRAWVGPCAAPSNMWVAVCKSTLQCQRATEAEVLVVALEAAVTHRRQTETSPEGRG